MGNLVLAADVGGTNLRMAAVDADGNVLHRDRASTPHDSDPTRVIGAIAELANKCRGALKDTGDITAIGVAFPATLDAAKGLIHFAPNLPMLNGIRLSADLEKLLGLNVILENDATSAAIGEHWLGASRGARQSICVTLGTGVGGGLIINDEPYRGPDGTAGEIGHICVEPDGHSCGCGSWGCLEQYSSATAVVRMAKELAAETIDSAVDGKSSLTAADIYGLAAHGDAVAVETYRKMGCYLGVGLAGLINMLNPETIVIAGGMAAAWDLFIEHTRNQIAKRAFREPAARAKLVRAELGDDAGILGVARVAFSTAKQGILEG